MDDRDWGRYSELVLQKLKDHEEVLKDINSALTEIHVEIAKLQIKSGVWGFLAGAIPVIVMLLLKFLITP